MSNPKTLLKKIVPERVRDKIRPAKDEIIIRLQLISGYHSRRDYYQKIKGDAIFLIGVPEHGNLGDQAITIGEEKLLDDVAPGKEIIYITENDFYKNALRIKKFQIKHPRTLILWHGGGNIGDLYRFNEGMRLWAIANFKDSKFIICPQSIDYRTTSKYLMKTAKIFNASNGLTLYTREKESYKKAKQFFPNCDIRIAPDPLLQYRPDIHKNKREKVLICARRDIEINQSTQNEIQRIADILNEKGIQYSFTDTMDNSYACKYGSQEAGLNAKWQQFASSEVVITDRLHGMIFALITNTPCIALNNSTGKVGSFYHTWLEDSEVLYIENEEDIEKVPGFIATAQDHVTDVDKLGLDRYFQELEDTIRSSLSGQ